MKVLLTGASGFLGKIIQATVDCRLHTLSRSHSDISCDIASSVPKLKFSPDIVIHAAGRAHVVSAKLADDQSFFDVNVTGTKNLIRGIEQAGGLPRSVVFVSSVAVYGVSKGAEISEDAPLRGGTAYADSKIQAEKILQEWGAVNSVSVAILRLPLLVGREPPGNLRRMARAIAARRYFSISGSQARRSMVLGEDVAHVLIKAAEVGGIYNLTDGCNPSVEEVARCIAERLGMSAPPRIPLAAAAFAGRVGDLLGGRAPVNSDVIEKLSSSLTFSDALARDRLGWSPSPVVDYLREVPLLVR